LLLKQLKRPILPGTRGRSFSREVPDLLFQHSAILGYAALPGRPPAGSTSGAGIRYS
jgi:hypothetical protein